MTMRGSAAACLLVLLCGSAVETRAKPINEAAEAGASPPAARARAAEPVPYAHLPSRSRAYQLLCSALLLLLLSTARLLGAADLEGVKKALANMKNKKTEINARSSDGSGRTAIMAATLKGSVEIVRLLLDEGANLTPVTKPNEWNVLQLAAFEGHDEILQMLIDAGAELDEQVEDGRTAVMMTAQMGRCPSTLKILMDAGADLHVRPQPLLLHHHLALLLAPLLPAAVFSFLFLAGLFCGSLLLFPAAPLPLQNLPRKKKSLPVRR